MVDRPKVHCVLQTTGSGALGISATDRGDLLASEVKSVVDCDEIPRGVPRKVAS